MDPDPKLHDAAGSGAKWPVAPPSEYGDLHWPPSLPFNAELFSTTLILYDRALAGNSLNTDLIYDVLRRHQPDHVLLRATRMDAAHGLTDITRLAGLLQRAEGHIRVRRLDRVSPLAVPVLLDIGRESVRTATDEDALLEETDALIAEATGRKSSFLKKEPKNFSDQPIPT